MMAAIILANDRTSIMRKLILFLYAATALLASCVPQRKIVYFHNEPEGKELQLPGEKPKEFEQLLQVGDIIHLQLYTVNPEAFPNLFTSPEKQVVDNRSSYEKGLLLDKNGLVDIPLIGAVSLKGLTITAAKDTLVNRFKAYIDNPVVILKKLSFKVTLLGEFNKPGLYYIPNEKITLTEAIGMGGELSNFANRTEMKIFRKTAGRLMEIPVDLTSKSILSPETVYLYPDDIVYVKALKRKALANIGPGLSIITSIISSTVLIATLIYNINK